MAMQARLPVGTAGRPPEPSAWPASARAVREGANRKEDITAAIQHGLGPSRRRNPVDEWCPLVEKPGREFHRRRQRCEVVLRGLPSKQSGFHAPNRPVEQRGSHRQALGEDDVQRSGWRDLRRVAGDAPALPDSLLLRKTSRLALAHGAQVAKETLLPTRAPRRLPEPRTRSARTSCVQSRANRRHVRCLLNHGDRAKHRAGRRRRRRLRRNIGTRQGQLALGRLCVRMLARRLHGLKPNPRAGGLCACGRPSG
mmetsp:Transcript_99067/g.284655  ORF Transcript_99067/g.284655 Transcript_99067/m.284655 type:complete len:254 (+) Transcript_99067:420-1181(+)